MENSDILYFIRVCLAKDKYRKKIEIVVLDGVAPDIGEVGISGYMAHIL